ncbi:MAG TPA: MFS transporter [Solirubrobacteraceae bacterium]|nr:MFS transporter [Solirubrobacteraceae bacterium]
MRHRDFRLLFTGQAVSVIGDSLFPIALAFAVLDGLQGSAGELGIVLAAQVLPMTLLVLVAGVWADRMSRRRLMLVSDLGRAAVQVVLAVLLLTGAAQLWQLIALCAVYGGFEAFFRPAAGGLTPALVPPGELQQANSLVGLAQNAGHVLGPAIAGVLIVVLSPGAAVAIDAATFVVSAAFLALVREPEREPHAEHAAPHFWSELKGGIAEVRARRWMLAFMPPFSAYHFVALPCVLALGAVLADRELGGAGSWAIIVSCFGAGTIAGSIAGLRWKPPRPMLAATLAFVAAACQPAIIALAGSTAAIAVLEALAGIAVAIGFTQWETTLGRLIPGRALSRVTSLDWFTTVGVMPLGYAVAGPLADTFGLHETMVGASVITVALFLAALAVREVRALPQESIAS